MTSSPRIILGLIASVACSSTTLLSASAFAQEKTASRPANWTRAFTALDHCAAYGPDFAPVEGTQACVKIGGHVRVEIGTRTLGRAGDHVWVQGSAAPAAMRTEEPIGAGSDFPTAHHLRLRQDADPAYQGWYLR